MSPADQVPRDAPMRPVGELGYSEASRELDEIVAFFEQREVDVDQLVARLERATAIVDELDRRLRRTRMQVEELAPRLARAESLDEPPTGTRPAHWRQDEVDGEPEGDDAGSESGWDVGNDDVGETDESLF